ncbi:hypothetical protein ACFFWD_08905 [Bradyrhizobium erythrophlei]|uniref:hypothetical protein n=1 Tax=Bradyrhizobium erythrophlei TaxID=1437360 RepID=UPI0035E89898
MSIARQSLTVLEQHLRTTVTKWRKLLDTARDPYRPELYYMRGPGPKWHAKHRQDNVL